jgi:hypothetical protein
MLTTALARTHGAVYLKILLHRKGAGGRFNFGSLGINTNKMISEF